MNIKEIESAIQQLSIRQVSELSVRYTAYQAGLWDRLAINPGGGPGRCQTDIFYKTQRAVVI